MAKKPSLRKTVAEKITSKTSTGTKFRDALKVRFDFVSSYSFARINEIRLVHNIELVQDLCNKMIQGQYT